MKVSKETWIRTGVLLVTLINQLFTVIGWNPLPFSEGELYQGLSALFTVGASLWSWWKNNSFTPAALQADAYRVALKEEMKNG